MTERAGGRGGVRVISIPSGEVHGLRSALDDGSGIHGSELWTGFVTSALLPDPAWVEAHADPFDVAHVHLGVGAMSPVALFSLTYRVSEPDSLAPAHRELYLSLIELQSRGASTQRVLQTEDLH